MDAELGAGLLLPYPSSPMLDPNYNPRSEVEFDPKQYIRTRIPALATASDSNPVS